MSLDKIADWLGIDIPDLAILNRYLPRNVAVVFRALDYLSPEQLVGLAAIGAASLLLCSATPFVCIGLACYATSCCTCCCRRRQQARVTPEEHLALQRRFPASPRAIGYTDLARTLAPAVAATSQGVISTLDAPTSVDEPPT